MAIRCSSSFFLILGSLLSYDVAFSAENLAIVGDVVVDSPFLLECSSIPNSNNQTQYTFIRGRTGGDVGNAIGIFIYDPADPDPCQDRSPTPIPYLFGCADNGKKGFINITVPRDVANTTDEHNVYWRCQTLSDPSAASNNEVLISITVPIQDIFRVPKENSLTVNADSPVTAQCSTSPGRPEADITWYLDNIQQMNGVTTDTTAVSGDIVVTNSYLTLTLDKSANGKVLRCSGTNYAEIRYNYDITINVVETGFNQLILIVIVVPFLIIVVIIIYRIRRSGRCDIPWLEVDAEGTRIHLQWESPIDCQPDSMEVKFGKTCKKAVKLDDKYSAYFTDLSPGTEYKVMLFCQRMSDGKVVKSDNIYVYTLAGFVTDTSKRNTYILLKPLKMKITSSSVELTWISSQDLKENAATVDYHKSTKHVSGSSGIYKTEFLQLNPNEVYRFNINGSGVDGRKYTSGEIKVKTLKAHKTASKADVSRFDQQENRSHRQVGCENGDRETGKWREIENHELKTVNEVKPTRGIRQKDLPEGPYHDAEPAKKTYPMSQSPRRNNKNPCQADIESSATLPPLGPPPDDGENIQSVPEEQGSRKKVKKKKRKKSKEA